MNLKKHVIANRDVTFKGEGSHRFPQKSLKVEKEKSLEGKKEKESGTCQSSSGKHDSPCFPSTMCNVQLYMHRTTSSKIASVSTLLAVFSRMFEMFENLVEAASQILCPFTV